jgi:hypothetical protein
LNVFRGPSFLEEVQTSRSFYPLIYFEAMVVVPFEEIREHLLLLDIIVTIPVVLVVMAFGPPLCGSTRANRAPNSCHPE